MTEESIKFTLNYLKKNPQEKSWGIFGGSADVWGGSFLGDIPLNTTHKQVFMIGTTPKSQKVVLVALLLFNLQKQSLWKNCGKYRKIKNN